MPTTDPPADAADARVQPSNSPQPLKRRHQDTFSSPEYFLYIGMLYILLGVVGTISFIIMYRMSTVAGPTLGITLVAAVIFTLLGIYFFATGVRRLPNVANKRFRKRYDGSIERMLHTSNINKSAVCLLLDGRKGEVRAIRYVLGREPVPYEVAEEFVRRVQLQR